MIERVYLLNGFSLLIGLGSIVTAASVTGFAIGRRLRLTREPQGRSALDTVIAAVLGLFGLLVAFTLSMAVARHDLRKVVMVDEANAIGTTYLRAELLPAPNRLAVRELLRDYVQADIDFYDAIADAPKVAKVNAHLGALQDQIWRHAVASAATDPRAVTTGLFIQSLNLLIDSHTRRIAVLRNYVPPTILLLLVVFAVVGATLTGYAIGLQERGDRVPAVLAALMTAAVVVIVFDIDRPIQGFIRVGQRSMLELRDYMTEHAP